MTKDIKVGDVLTSDILNEDIVEPLNTLGNTASEILFKKKMESLSNVGVVSSVVGSTMTIVSGVSITDGPFNIIVDLQNMYGKDSASINSLIFIHEEDMVQHSIASTKFSFSDLLSIQVNDGAVSIKKLNGPSGYDGKDSPKGLDGPIGFEQYTSDRLNYMFNSSFNITQFKTRETRPPGANTLNDIYICDGYYNESIGNAVAYTVRKGSDNFTQSLTINADKAVETSTNYINTGLVHPIHNRIACHLLARDDKMYLSFIFKASIDGKYDAVVRFGKPNRQTVVKRSWVYKASEHVSGYMAVYLPIYDTVADKPLSIRDNSDISLDGTSVRGIQVAIAPTFDGTGHCYSDPLDVNMYGVTDNKTCLSPDAVKYMKLGGSVEIVSPGLTNFGYMEQRIPALNEYGNFNYTSIETDAIDAVRALVYYENILSSEGISGYGPYLRGVSNGLAEDTGDGLIPVRFRLPKFSKQYNIVFETNKFDTSPFKCYWIYSLAASTSGTLKSTGTYLANGDSVEHQLYGFKIRSKISQHSTAKCIYSVGVGIGDGIDYKIAYDGRLR